MSDQNNTTIDVPATVVPEVTPPVVTPTNNEEVRDPATLLRLFNEQKETIKALKEFRDAKEAESAKAEQDRLLRDQQYEALLPIKIEEASKPLVASISTLESDKVTLADKLAASDKRYEDLKVTLRDNAAKDALYSEFVKAKGDSEITKDNLWDLYGSKVTFAEDNSPVGLSDVITALQSDPMGKRLFNVVLPSGSGAPTVPVSPANKAKDVRTVALSEIKKGGKVSLEDIVKGNVVVSK